MGSTSPGDTIDILCVDTCFLSWLVLLPGVRTVVLRLNRAVNSA